MKEKNKCCTQKGHYHLIGMLALAMAAVTLMQFIPFAAWVLPLMFLICPLMMGMMLMMSDRQKHQAQKSCCKVSEENPALPHE